MNHPKHKQICFSLPEAVTETNYLFCKNLLCGKKKWLNGMFFYLTRMHASGLYRAIYLCYLQHVAGTVLLAEAIV
jgi:hypothetical protein